MPATATAPRQPKEIKIVPIIGQDLVTAAMPEKTGLHRVIKFLWDGHFRVNYQDKYPPHYILDSHFVTIQDGKAIPDREKKATRKCGED
jgi:hypothetical protein